MPGGLSFDSAQSYVAFVVIKYVGYTAVSTYFNSQYLETKAKPWLFGLTRTLLGMLLGAVAGLLGLVHLGLAIYVFMAGLIPFRIFEWYATLWLFFRRDPNFKPKAVQNIAVGTGVSFALDIPAAIGFIATGGFWIC